jgi:uncharacterized membrane protein (UPF0127 family)
MRLLRVVNTRRNRELGSRIGLANRWLARLRGMLGRPAPAAGEGLLLTPCRSIHMYGMRFSLDVAFLDAEGAIIAMYPSLAPGARTRWHGRAVHALELPSGTLSETGTLVGDSLVWLPQAVSSTGAHPRNAQAVS